MPNDGGANVEVRVTDGPLPAASPWTVTGAGACLGFEGVVRPTEDGRPISALLYEDYEPMTSTQLRALAETLLARHELLAIIVEHSRGRVPAGQVSFRLRVASVHRKEALRAVDEFIDELKRDVALWKVPEAPGAAPDPPARERGDGSGSA